jgi:hypothetical protein
VATTTSFGILLGELPHAKGQKDATALVGMDEYIVKIMLGVKWKLWEELTDCRDARNWQ